MWRTLVGFGLAVVAGEAVAATPCLATFRPPAGESEDAWAAPLALAGLCLADPEAGAERGPGARVGLDVVGGEARLWARAADGTERVVVLPAPAGPDDREAVAWLGASLLHEVAPPVAAPPAAGRGRSDSRPDRARARAWIEAVGGVDARADRAVAGRLGVGAGARGARGWGLGLEVVGTPAASLPELGEGAAVGTLALGARAGWAPEGRVAPVLAAGLGAARRRFLDEGRVIEAAWVPVADARAGATLRGEGAIALVGSLGVSGDLRGTTARRGDDGVDQRLAPVGVDLLAGLRVGW